MVKEIKVVVVGEANIGKTCLCGCFVSNEFPEAYIPTVWDNYSKDMEHEGQKYRLTIWDTAGQAEFSRMTQLTYPETDVFILCFSLGNSKSLEAVKTVWAKEIANANPRVPVVLCGTKADIRQEMVGKVESSPALARKFDQTTATATATEKLQQQLLVPFRDGKRMAKDLPQVMKYIECSAKTGQDVTKVFQTALKLAVKIGEGKKKKNCVIL
eukprot:m.63774 g.63774  ORF g.63774 m.63774 type:complete len:213 (+) comp19489_c0_seq5:64-702(+)